MEHTQADTALSVYVHVVDFGLEGCFGWAKGVVIGDRDAGQGSHGRWGKVSRSRITPDVILLGWASLNVEYAALVHGLVRALHLGVPLRLPRKQKDDAAWRSARVRSQSARDGAAYFEEVVCVLEAGAALRRQPRSR